MSKRSLYKQLIDSGSTPSEAESLSKLATKLTKSTPSGMTKEAKSRIARQIGVRRTIQVPRLVIVGVGAMAVLVIGVVSVLPALNSSVPATKNSSEESINQSASEPSDQIVDTKREKLDQLITEEAPEKDIERAEQEYKEAIGGNNGSINSNKKPPKKERKHSEVYENWLKNRKQNNSGKVKNLLR